MGTRLSGHALALVLVGCGGETRQQTEAESGAPSESQTTTTAEGGQAATSTTNTASTTAEPLAFNEQGFTTIPIDSELVVYWSPSEFTNQTPKLRHVIEGGSLATNDLSPAALQLVLPFGAPPAESGILRGWTIDGDAFATGGTSSPRWPAECLGFSPDVDGDLIVDDCDPISIDGPTADFDGDGFPNGEDVCPAIPDPDQIRNGSAHDGDACYPRDPAVASNVARLMVITTTVEEQNAVRAATGLAPIEWPVVQNPSPEVQDWCGSFPEPNENSEPTPEAIAEAVEHLQNMPAVFGFTAEQRSEYAQTWVAIVEAFPEIEDGTASELQMQEFVELREQITPYSIILSSSDQSCLAQ